MLVLLVLVGGELATLAVPMAYSRVVDRLSHPGSLAMAPFALILGYGLVRLVSAALTNLRDSCLRLCGSGWRGRRPSAVSSICTSSPYASIWTAGQGE